MVSRQKRELDFNMIFLSLTKAYTIELIHRAVVVTFTQMKCVSADVFVYQCFEFIYKAVTT